MSQQVELFYRTVRDDLLALLRQSHLSDAFSAAIEMGLAQDGKVLSPAPRSRWPLLVLLPCWAAGGDWQAALPVATAAELVGAASDLFDEIEDGDDSPLVAAIGAPRTVNVASALLALAGRSLSRAAVSMGSLFWQALLAAADGQHQDLGSLPPATPEEYLELVDRKSAGLISALCSAGARLAGASPEAVAGYGQFGLHLGRWTQFLNDLHDVWPDVKGKSDLQRRLVTLPVLFLLRSPESASRERLRRHLASDGPLLPTEERALRDALWASGALHYTWLMAETNRSAAEAALREVCPSPGADVILELLLPPVAAARGVRDHAVS